MQKMFDAALHVKKLPLRALLMDSWYATKDLMMHLHGADKAFYCPIKSNHKVDDSGGKSGYVAVSDSQWSTQDDALGKLIKVH